MDSTPERDLPPTVLDATPPKPRFKIGPNAWAAGQWGLASVLLNTAFLLCMPLNAIIFTLLPMSIRSVDFWDDDSMVAASIMLLAIPIMMTVFTLLGLVFAVSGWFVGIWNITRHS
jgi:hypothetical protein